MIGAKLLSKMGSREKMALGFAVIMLTAWMIDALVVSSFVRRFDRMDADVAVLEHKLEGDLTTLGMRDAVLADYAAIQGLLGKTKASQEAMTALQDEIDEMSRRNDLTVGSYRNKAPTTAGVYEEYRIQIDKLDGRMTDLLKFLYELRMSPGMLRVSRLDLSPGDARGDVTGSMVITKVMIRGSAAD